MSLTPRRLVRLFPRIWRARYGVEFEALLESSDLTPRDVLNILRHAAGEWIAHTVIGRYVLGVMLASAATLIALGLAAIPPRVPIGSWPIELSALFGFLLAATSIRFLVCLATRKRTSGREQAVWIAALFVTCVGGQWGQMVGWRESTVAGPSVLSIWLVATALMTSTCMNTLGWSRILPRGQAAVRLRQRPPTRPLGLA
jgi:hypothetical protein